MMASSSFAFQNKTFAPPHHPESTPPQTPVTSPRNSNTPLASPPARPPSFSRIPPPPGSTRLPRPGSRIVDQFPKPPSHKPAAPPAPAPEPQSQLRTPRGKALLVAPISTTSRDHLKDPNRSHREDISPTKLTSPTKLISPSKLTSPSKLIGPTKLTGPSKIKTPQRTLSKRLSQLPTPGSGIKSLPTPSHARFGSVSAPRRLPQLSVHSRSSSAAMTAVHPNIPLPIGVMIGDHGSIDLSELVDETSRAPKSPSNRFTSLFRWGSTSEQGAGSAPAEHRVPTPSLQSLQMSPRSSSSQHSLSPTNNRIIPPAIDIPRANASQTNEMYSDSDSLFQPSTPVTFEAIEKEVRAVSADLAASIRREMDLEDLIERLQAEASERGGRRTSDYFSDAGTPARVLDTGCDKELDAEKMVRKVEQEKAQLRLDMLEKVQEERERRRIAETQVKELEDLVAKASPAAAVSYLAPPNAPVPAQVKDLELALEDAHRKLAEERLMKGSFEDLLTSLKGELETSRSERDNLRDEIVPQLRARVEGLESETSNLQKFMYEHEHMQQELMVLKTENASLAVAIREKTEQQLQAQATIQAQLEAQAEAQAQAEAEVTMLQSPIPIHNHAVHAHVVQAQLVQIQTQFHSRPVSMAQPFGTPSTPTNPGMVNPKDRESLTERLKDVETQRDALHSALKSLRDRQQIETKKARERIRVLEIERERSLHPSLRKQTRDKEASALRREVYRLRQRADDALEQKFVCERSLGTLMMDLEKAGQETATLRVLLQEHDDLISQHDESKEPHIRLSGEISELKQRPKSEISSVSLQQAYRDLQSLHARSLARLDELESRTVDPSHVSESERRLSSLQEEQNLAAQLRISSERVEELATQVRAQLASNEILRERLADCIGRGEIDQKASAKKINALQDKLRILEDNVIEAQQLAEDAVSQHEDEIRRIQETHTSQLRRLKTGGASSAGLKPSSSPILRSPKLEWTSVRRLSTTDATKTANLEKRVSELERALSDADDEMSEVVSRMNKAQIEVLELQTERDEAVRQTRRLQTDFVTQRAKFSKIS